MNLNAPSRGGRSFSLSKVRRKTPNSRKIEGTERKKEKKKKKKNERKKKREKSYFRVAVVFVFL